MDKVNLNDFSKSGLVGIIGILKERGILSEDALATLLRLDLIRRTCETREQLDVLGPALDTEKKRLKPISLKKQYLAYNKKVGRYNRLVRSGAKLVKKIEGLEKAFPKIKTGGDGK